MTRIEVAKPWVGDEEVAAVAETISSGWLAQGSRVAAFESKFAAMVGAEYAVAVANCTAGLHLALVLAGIGPGSEVVVPSFSFIATTNAVRYVGAEPVFADVEVDTGNLSVATIARVISPETRAVIIVHQGGVPADVDEIRAYCQLRGIIVIEDAACAAGSLYKSAPVGVGAAVAAWSFHPRKLITTGEGGMLTTDNAEWAQRARRLREHAMSVSAAQRHLSTLAPAEQYLEVGFNYRMTDLQAAVGIVQLDRLAEIVARRRAIVARYQENLSDLPGLRLLEDPRWGRSNFQSFWIEVLPTFPLDREQLMRHLADDDISARRGIMAAHRQPAYAPLNHAPLPITERLTDHTLILPVFHQLTEQQQDRVITSLRSAARIAVAS